MGKTASHLSTYPARLKKPILAHPMTGHGRNRTVPGGSVVTVTANSAHVPGETVYTLTVELDGTLYARDLQVTEFEPIEK